MRNLMRIVISMSIVAGLSVGATAQPAKPAPPAAPPAKTPAPPTPPAKTPATPPAKTPPPAAQPAPPAAPAMPTPSAEVAAYVKANTGTWKCTGKMFMPDGTAADMKATMKTKFALDKFWAQTTFVETKKKGFKFESFRTFDGKKWHGIMADNMGSQEVSWSDGPKENKAVWESTSRSAMGEAKARHHEETVGPKEMKLWGEYSLDKGKTWVKAYEASCKK
jgi:type IV secretory pathway VirB10-like protein